MVNLPVSWDLATILDAIDSGTLRLAARADGVPSELRSILAWNSWPLDWLDCLPVIPLPSYVVERAR